MYQTRKIFQIILMLFFALGTNYASANYAPAENFISDLSTKALKIIESKEAENKKLVRLEEIFDQAVDTNWMAKFAISKFWKLMTDVEKQKYLQAYRHYLMKTYVPKFKEYNNQIIKITGSKDMGNNQYIVSTQIISNKGAERNVLNISYRCKEENNTFQIRDISGEDFSLLATQRAEFAAVVTKDGVGQLITMLAEK